MKQGLGRCGRAFGLCLGVVFGGGGLSVSPSFAQSNPFEILPYGWIYGETTHSQISQVRQLKCSLQLSSRTGSHGPCVSWEAKNGTMEVTADVRKPRTLKTITYYRGRLPKLWEQAGFTLGLPYGEWRYRLRDQGVLFKARSKYLTGKKEGWAHAISIPTEYHHVDVIFEGPKADMEYLKPARVKVSKRRR